MARLLRNDRVLWTLQILLAALYLFAGGFKLVASPDAMRASPADPIPAPAVVAFLRLIGGFEVTGALGLILPGLTGIRRNLTAVAAGCLTIIMIGAVVTSIAMIGLAAAILPFVVGALDVVVMLGRYHWETRTMVSADAPAR
jgi:uncharacterized membrane protein YphA (DoxX/SURF4 family)